ncbi:aspartyl protease family protein [Stenotrophomonas sp. Sa5BUN4]|uniref:Aspartyl protease family protein n=1 Tax=Stenotrophomonas lacuserhaii TaxID=2760084 RepID=A0A8X8FNI5_9GAMM|nr:aspartyl protease family protein [Stenotrophomonas pennii]MBD7952921.1 aspartyl protease family protein [Stenotrophomonas pennii]
MPLRAPLLCFVFACSLLSSGALAADASEPADDACALASRPLRAPDLQVPFDIVDGRIYLQVQVNGRGPFRFAVDTGASGIGRADSRLATTLDLLLHGQATTSDGVSSASVQTVRIDSLALGAVVRRDVEVITRDYNAHNAPEAAFMGILGRGFFGDGLLVIDYPRRMLSFSRTQQLPTQGPNVLRYEQAFRVPVRIGREQVLGQLDTGANVSFVLPRVLYDTVSARPLEAAGRSRLTNSQVEAQRATVQGPIEIGQLRLADVEVRVSAKYPELLIGAHALQQAVVLIDQRARAVAICR